MGKAENYVEGYLVKEVERRRGFVMKLSAAFLSGVPDRLVVLNGRTVFVETKAKNGSLSAIQKHRIGLIRRAGGVVHVVNSREMVDELMEELEA